MPRDRARLEKAVELVLRLAEGDFAARGELSDQQDEIDGIVVGLNMLAEELGAEHAARVHAEGLLRDEVDAYEHAPGLFCSVDITTLVVLKCNETLAGAVGRTKEEILGRSLLDLLATESREAARKAFFQIAAGARAYRTDYELLSATGTRLTVEMIASTVPELGRIRVVLRDVTAQRSTERQLIQAQKLQGIGRLAAGVAHDFNNMLTVILSAASIAKQGTREGSDLSNVLTEIELAARAGAELTKELLVFSRKSVVSPRIASLVDVVDRAQKFLRRLIGDDVRVEVKHMSEPWNVLIDVSQFEQLVMNLAINGRDAMPEGGTLTLETANVVLDAEYAAAHLNVAPGDYAMLAVTDTGTGMTRETLEHAFEPFFTTKAQGKGTGLGLSVCLGIVEQAGGSIWLYSEPGHGTIVKVYVPRFTGERAAESAPDGAVASGGTETILLAEDDARVRTITARILRSAGYRVLEATNGKHALDIALAHAGTIDLVVTDVMMPELGGRQLVEALRARGIVTRALYVSGHTENSIVHHGVLESGIEFLPKPFGSATLLARVRELLSHPGRK